MGDVYTNPPQSRNEAILNSIVEGTTYTAPPQSRIEDLLLQVKDVIEEGGHDESATRASIAPTESDSAHASKNIAVGEQFYLSDDKLYTATSTISQGTAIVTTGAGQNCEVSKSVTGQIADRMTYADNGILGAKNILPIKLSIVKSLNTTGTWSNNVYTINNVAVTFTAENDNVTEINLNGQASSNITNLYLTNSLTLKKGNYIGNGNPSEITGDVGLRLSTSSFSINTFWGQGVVLDMANDTSNLRVDIRVPSGTSFSNAKFYPMIRLATDSDPTYQPYAQTNRELTTGKTDTTVIGNTEDGATASQAYAQGKFFIRGGKFGKAKTAIAQGDTFTLNTNYEETSIADVLYEIMNS